MNAMNDDGKYPEELTDDQVAYLRERAAERRGAWERHKQEDSAMEPHEALELTILEAAKKVKRLRKALHKIAQQDYDAGYTAETFAEAVLSDWPGILDE